MVTVTEVADETPTVRTLAFEDDVMPGVLPGQFAMVWIPGIGEMPMSVMIHGKEGTAAFTVRRHGTTSTGLFNVRAGQQIGVRGPYGNSFDVRPGRLLLVGGGTGLVPLVRLLKFAVPQDDITLLIGSRTKDEVFFEDLANDILRRNRHEVIVTTDDGSYGTRGTVTDLASQIIGQQSFDAVYTCGPEIMMYKTVQAAHAAGIFVQASLERMMKCGMGMCGSCCVGSQVACRDGTVLDGPGLLSNAEFGRSYRTKAGIPENY